MPRVAIAIDSLNLAIDDVTRAALEQAITVLRKHGVEFTTTEHFPQAAQLAEIHRVVMNYEFARSLASATRHYPDLLSPALREAVTLGLTIPNDVYLARRAEQQQLRYQWDEMAGD